MPSHTSVPSALCPQSPSSLKGLSFSGNKILDRDLLSDSSCLLTLLAQLKYISFTSHSRKPSLLSFEGPTANVEEILREFSVTVFLPVAEWNHGLVLIEVFANGNGHQASVKEFDQTHTDWTLKRAGKYLEDKAV